jgi:Flp pilus assembly pilin Flp
MQILLSRFCRSGVTAMEYGLTAALISVVCIAMMTFAERHRRGSLNPKQE